MAEKTIGGLLFAGFMCGTSLDGVDGALIRIIHGKVELLAFQHHSFSLTLTNWIRQFLSGDGTAESIIEQWGDLENLLAETETELLSKLCDSAGISPWRLHGAATHGITVYHKPTPHIPPWENGKKNILPGSTVQIANPYPLARKFGIPVVFDFRRADVAHGGEGAPLATLFHRAVFSDPLHPRGFLNLGGIANLTFIPPPGKDGRCLSFDTGPGNMLLDLAVSHLTHGKEPYDKGGERSASGTSRSTVVEFLLDERWLLKPPPKSTGREQWGKTKFNDLLAFLKKGEPIPANDLLASLAETTAIYIQKGLEWLDTPPDLLIIGGGGSHNTDLVDRITRITGIPSVKTDQFGWPPQAIESMAFAYLAALTLSGRPSSLPSTTGSQSPSVAGSISPPQDGSLPARIQEICQSAEIHLPFPDRATPPGFQIPGS